MKKYIGAIMFFGALGFGLTQEIKCMKAKVNLANETSWAAFVYANGWGTKKIVERMNELYGKQLEACKWVR